VVGQQGHVLLHSSTRVWVSEGGANGGGDRGGVRWSGGRISSQNQSVDWPKDTGGASSHHRVDVPGVTVDGDRAVTDGSERAAGTSGAAACGRGRLAAVIDEGGVGEASRARRRGRAWRRRGRQSRAWRGRG
jgi:hypothetical protein